MEETEVTEGNGAKELNDKLSFWNRVQIPAPTVALLVLVSLVSGDTIWDRVEETFGFKRPATPAEIIVECVNRARVTVKATEPEDKMSAETFFLVVDRVCSPPVVLTEVK